MRLGKCPKCFGHGPLHSEFRDDEGRLPQFPPCSLCGLPAKVADLDVIAGMVLGQLNVGVPETGLLEPDGSTP